MSVSSDSKITAEPFLKFHTKYYRSHIKTFPLRIRINNFKKIPERSGPTIDFCGNPAIISHNEL